MTRRRLECRNTTPIGSVAVCDIRSTGVTSPYPHGIIGSVSGSCVKRGRRATYPTSWTFPSASSYSKSHPHLCAQQDGLSPPGVYSGLILASVTAPLVSRGRSCVEPSCPSKLLPRKPQGASSKTRHPRVCCGANEEMHTSFSGTRKCNQYSATPVPRSRPSSFAIFCSEVPSAESSRW